MILKDKIEINIKNIKENKNILNEKNIILSDLVKEIEKHNASKTILTKLFESKDSNTIINKITFSAGYEKAIEATLGYGLKASLSKSNIEWRNINQANLYPLPSNIPNLENTIKGVTEITNLLKSTGLVKNKLEGEKNYKICFNQDNNLLVKMETYGDGTVTNIQLKPIHLFIKCYKIKKI